MCFTKTLSFYKNFHQKHKIFKKSGTRDLSFRTQSQGQTCDLSTKYKKKWSLFLNLLLNFIFSISKTRVYIYNQFLKEKTSKSSTGLSTNFFLSPIPAEKEVVSYFLTEIKRCGKTVTIII